MKWQMEQQRQQANNQARWDYADHNFQSSAIAPTNYGTIHAPPNKFVYEQFHECAHTARTGTVTFTYNVN
jgi:hypothetical protein